MTKHKPGTSAKGWMCAALAIVMLMSCTITTYAADAYGNTTAAAAAFSMAIDSQGVLWGWGDNAYGQLGDGTNVARVAPVKVMEDVVSIAVGLNHTLAIKSDDSLWGWGSNNLGQVGDGTNQNQRTPVKIMDGVAMVKVCDNLNIVVKNDGSLWVWGENKGQKLIANGGNVISSPARVLDNVAFADTNGVNIAVIRTDGTLWIWGDNTYGLIGDGTVNKEESTLTETITPPPTETATPPADGDETEETESPEPPLPTTTTHIIPAEYNDRYSPVRILENIDYVVLGKYHAAALGRDGSLYAWGKNDRGQLGMGIGDDIYHPYLVLRSVIDVALGENHTLALTGDGGVLSWGANDRGQLGDGGYDDRGLPVRITAISNAVSVAAKGNMSAVLTYENGLYLWGANDNSAVGDGSSADRNVPSRIMNNAVAVLLAGTHTFATDTDGALWAWGRNNSGQLGDNTTTTRPAAVKVMDSVALAGQKADKPAETAPPAETKPAIEVGDVNDPNYYKINYSLLEGITDDLSAINAISEVAQGMNTSQKDNRNNADAVTRFAEHAVMKALEVQYTQNSLNLNADFLKGYESSVTNLSNMAFSLLQERGLAPDRKVEASLHIILPAAVTEITVNSNIAGSTIERVVVSAGEIDIIIDKKLIKDSFIINIPAEAIKAAADNAAPDKTGAFAGVRITVTGQMNGGSQFYVGIPAVPGVADKSQTIINASNENIGGKVNPNTNKIETTINASVTLTASQSALTFPDIGHLDAETQSAIMYLKNKGRVKGRQDGSFDPDAPITRAEFGAMLLFAFSKEDPNADNGGFDDVSSTDWFKAIAGTCKSNGYITGYEDNTFRPNIQIPKVQLLAIAGRVLKQSKNYIIVDGASYLTKYLDYAEIDYWFYDDVAFLIKSRLVSDFPNSIFIPDYEMNRGEAAVIISNLYKRVY